MTDKVIDPKCESHPTQLLISMCVTKGCNALLCKKCLTDHSKIHIKNKTTMDLCDLDDARAECLHKIQDTSSQLRMGLEEMSCGPIEKTKKMIDRTREQSMKAVQTFFDKLEVEMKDKVNSHKEIKSIINDSGNMELIGSINSHLQNLEKDIANLKNENLYLTVLHDLLANDLDHKLKVIKDETTDHTQPLKLYVEDQYPKALEASLAKSVQVFFNPGTATLMQFPPHLRDADDTEVSGGNPTIIKKKGFASASVVLGGPMNTGINTFKVKIDVISNGQGWVSLGIIDKCDLNFKTNNYSQAYCVCSDQSFYKLTITNQTSVTTGGIFSFKVDFFKNELEISSDNGFAAKAVLPTGKSYYPYFELTHPHQLSVLSFTHGTK
jgi:hypothetical protein